MATLQERDVPTSYHMVLATRPQDFWVGVQALPNDLTVPLRGQAEHTPAPTGALLREVRALRAEVARLRRQVAALCEPQQDPQWRAAVYEHYATRVAEVPGAVAVAAWSERDGLVVVTVMEGYDREAEDRVIECELTAYREHLSHMLIDFEIRTPGPQLESELRSLADAVLWRRQ